MTVHTRLKRKTTLKAYTKLEQKTPLKKKQKTARKLDTPYFSIFTNDLSRCVITGEKNAEPHHIFNGSNKALSEKYGFILPLRADWHRIAAYSIHQDKRLRNKYRIACEKYYVEILGKTREEWIKEFGMWWDEESA